MKALTYQGAKNVRVETVPDPVLAADDDIILRVTATAICGSDLHIYRGKIPMMKDGDILGHEFMGIVEEAGPAVTRVRKGDRVVIPFVIACGECFYCNQDAVRRLRDHQPRAAARIVNKKRRDARRGAVRLQPSVWRLRRRAGRVRARAEGQRRPAQGPGRG